MADDARTPDDPRDADAPFTDAELERYFASPDARRRDAGDDELAEFFGSPDVATDAPAPPVGGDGASGGDGALIPDDELALFFASPDAVQARRSAGGDGAWAAAIPPPRPATKRSSRRRRTMRVLTVAMGVVGLGVLAGLGVVAYFWPQLPSLEQIENPKNLLATIVLTADDAELARYYDGENRTWVPLDQISPHAVDALLATEDRRFYDHWGVDAKGLLAVLYGALTEREFRGASTVTMQLSRNLYKEDVNYVIGEKSVIRKIKEILTSIRIERIYTKDEILEAYLNTVPFLYNAYGIESAATTYFGKPASELAPEEAAVLIGMLAANTAYDPVKNPEASRSRRNVVLQNMVGQGMLSADEAATYKAAPIQLNFKPYSHEDNIAPHFAEVLRIWFKEWCDKNGYDPYADGLVIRTTIDSRMQALATDAVREQMDKLDARTGRSWGSSANPYGYWWRRNTAIVNEYIADTEPYQVLRRDGVEREAAIARLREDAAFMDSLKASRMRVEAGLVAMDPESGQVKAWVGGRDYVADQYDHVGTARRQPGSTFKLFAYTTAVAEGYGPGSVVSDTPFKWGDWNPKNSGGYSGDVSLSTALAQSKNVVAARITKHFGPQKINQTAREMGIRSDLMDVRSTALGTNDVTVLEMAAAYATVANEGVYHGPSEEEERPTDPAVPAHITLAVQSIEDRYGNVIEDFTPAGREVLNESTAYTVFDMMRGVIRRGTARNLGGSFPATRRLDLAGKTGTTQENADGWFVAMHPKLVVVSWTGFNDRRVKYRSTATGQGARTGLLNVGGFLQKLQTEGDSTIQLSADVRYERPEGYSSGRSARIGKRGFWRGDRSSARGRTRSRSSSSGRSRSEREADAGPARELLNQYQQRDRARAAPAPAPAPPPPPSNSGGRIGW